MSVYILIVIVCTLTAPALAKLLAVGQSHSCVLLEDRGRLLCWGDNEWGQAGYDPSNIPFVESLQASQLLGGVTVNSAQHVIGLHTGSMHTCLVYDSGNVHCFGPKFETQWTVALPCTTWFGGDTFICTRKPQDDIAVCYGNEPTAMRHPCFGDRLLVPTATTTHTAVPTHTPTVTASTTTTPTQTQTETSTTTATKSDTITSTRTQTGTFTATAIISGTTTPSQTQTGTATTTATGSLTPTPTHSQTSSATAMHSSTSSETQSTNSTATETPSSTSSPTGTQSSSATRTPSTSMIPATSCRAAYPAVATNASDVDQFALLQFPGRASMWVLCETSYQGGGWHVLWRSPWTEAASVADWEYSGTATVQYWNRSSGEYSQPELWSVPFQQWCAGSPSLGYYCVTRGEGVRFNTSINLGSVPTPNAGTNGCAAGCGANNTCTFIPGATQDTYYEGYYFGFNQNRPNSGHTCRLVAGWDDDQGFNDKVHGVMCGVGGSWASYRHCFSGGYRLMARNVTST